MIQECIDQARTNKKPLFEMEAVRESRRSIKRWWRSTRQRRFLLTDDIWNVCQKVNKARQKLDPHVTFNLLRYLRLLVSFVDDDIFLLTFPEVKWKRLSESSLMTIENLFHVFRRHLEIFYIIFCTVQWTSKVKERRDKCYYKSWGTSVYKSWGTSVYKI